MKNCYEMVKNFKRKYPATIAFRLAKHCKMIEMHLNPGEEVIYAFPAQKNSRFYEIFYTNVVAVTNKRILIATKRLFFGSFFISITPDMFNDITIHEGLIWGNIVIDTIKEEVVLSNISRKALQEIETVVTESVIRQKKEYGKFLKSSK